jgi:putative lipoic acid-binding regulatory protein
MAQSCDCGASQPKPPLDELVECPCDYIFKAFGPNNEAFAFSVRSTIGKTVFAPLDAIKVRASSKGEYQCVTVVVRLQNVEQLKTIYSDLQQLAELKYLL